MSAPSFFRQAAALLAGRWQIPLAICAAATAGIALYRLRPERLQPQLDALLADLDALRQAGRHMDAADAAANLLAMNPPLPERQRAILHDYLAQTIFVRESQREVPVPANIRQVLVHQTSAAELGLPVQADGLLRTAWAHESLGSTGQAIAGYRAVLERDPPADIRRPAAQALVRLLENRPDAVAERQRWLHALLTDEGIEPDYLWWALLQAIGDALDEQDTLRAGRLVAEYGDRLKTSDLAGYHDYLSAWVLVHEGRTGEAAPLVRWIDEWLASRPSRSQDLEQRGYLPALNRWLLGRIHLAENRPEDALEVFGQALKSIGAPYTVPPALDDVLIAATVGRGEALNELGQHDAARTAFREAAARLSGAPARHAAGLARFQRTLVELFERGRVRGDYEIANRYLALAAELTPPDRAHERLDLCETLGREYEALAERAAEPEQQRAQRAEAGRYFEQAADVAGVDEARQATLLWSAARNYDQGWIIGAARRVLVRFVEGRSADPRLPKALLMLGQALEATGGQRAAIERYRQLAETFPRLEEAAQARLSWAKCLTALGPEHCAEAERQLFELLSDGNIAPDACVFRDALLALGELLYDLGRYGEALGRLEDFLGLYPDDPERRRIRFMLADGYRRSALALRDQATGGASRDRLLAESRTRFLRAAALFAVLCDDLDEDDAPDEAWSRYQRLALLYRGDCLFEVNEPGTLAEALAIYQSAAARYLGEPAALTAQVQIANVHLRQGQLIEAARALERARWLLRSTPDEAFEAYRDGTDRAYWDRYLTAMAASDLLGEPRTGMR